MNLRETKESLSYANLLSAISVPTSRKKMSIEHGLILNIHHVSIPGSGVTYMSTDGSQTFHPENVEVMICFYKANPIPIARVKYRKWSKGIPQTVDSFEIRENGCKGI